MFTQGIRLAASACRDESVDIDSIDGCAHDRSIGPVDLG